MTKNKTKDINKKKITKALTSKVLNTKPTYDVHISFDLTSDQDMNDPIKFLYKKISEKFVDNLVVGSGTCLMTGLRDFTFNGTKEEMTKIMKLFLNSPYRIDDIHINSYSDW